MANNHTYTFKVPSNLKAGTYVIRHEIISLHFALRGSGDQSGIPLNGAEIYPVCFNIDVIGDGIVAPPTIGKFPGIYERKDPGILVNIYFGPNRYVSARLSEMFNIRTETVF
jgi:lytic cellulose monooxygenase (C1-hydroxylating)